MSERHFDIQVVDDGARITVQILYLRHIGSACVGPFTMLSDSFMSFPEADEKQWVKDMLVHMIEKL